MSKPSGETAALLHKFSIALALSACLAYLGSEIFLFSRLGLPLDDGWIHMQFARQASLGEGLAFNPGLLVTGSTSTLWTSLLTLGFLLPVSPLAWAKLLGIGGFLATVIACDRLAAHLGARGLGRSLASLWVASTHWLVWSALSGMEIILFSALSLWGLSKHLEERREPRLLPWSLVLFALAALARPEGYLLLLLALADRFLPGPGVSPTELTFDRSAMSRRFVHGLAGALVLVLPVLIFHRWIGDSWVPTTFSVKASAPAGILPDGRYLRTAIGIFFDAQPFALLLAGAGGIRMLSGFTSGLHRSLLPLAWPVGLVLAYASLSSGIGPPVVGNFGRYFFPLFPVLAVLAAVGIGSLLDRLQALRLAGRSLRLGWLLTALLLLPQLLDLAQGPLRYTQTIANVEDSDVRAALWLRDRLDPEALLAVQDIGALKYHLPNRVLDLAGIVTPEIVPILRADDGEYWERRLLRFLEERRPDYLVVFPGSYPMLTERTDGFRRVASFPVESNVTMAGDELAIFATPWNQYPLVSIDP